MAPVAQLQWTMTWTPAQCHFLDRMAELGRKDQQTPRRRTRPSASAANHWRLCLCQYQTRRTPIQSSAWYCCGISPCSHAPFSRVATTQVSSPRDRAVSTGSHMQRNMVMSLAPPRLGALLCVGLLTVIVVLSVCVCIKECFTLRWAASRL